MSKANTRVVVMVDPAFMTAGIFEGSKGPIADIRWAPFELPRSREGHGVPETVTVNITRRYAPGYFFDRVREIWNAQPEGRYYDFSPMPHSEETFVDIINIWMGIVDHFGLEADYQPSFFEVVKPVILEILTSGYREDPKDANPSNDRHFNDHVYSREDFQKEFSRFISKHQLLF